MKTPRITYILPTLVTGGAEVQSITQLNEFARRNVDVQLIILSKRNFMSDKLDPRIPYEIIGSEHLDVIHLKSFFSFFRYRKKVLKALKSFNPDYIVCHLPVSHFFGRFLKILSDLPGKIICYHHSTHYKIYPNNTVKRKVFQHLNQYLAKVDFANFFISKAVQKDVEDNMKINRPFIISNAVAQTTINKEESKGLIAKFNLTPNDYYVVPGRLVEIKGQDLFLKTVAPIIRKHQIKIVCAGFGSFKNKLMEIVNEEQISHLVSFTGLVDNYDMLAIIQNSIFVIVPSRFEGLGNVVIEAYMMGKTVLTSNVGGLPEVVKDKKTGYLYDSPEELYNLFEKMVLNPAKYLKQESEQIKEFQDNYIIEKQVDHIQEFFKTHL